MREVDFDNLPRETLVKLLKLYSRLFLALDGFWFLAAKDKYGYSEALELDAVAWEGYFPYEAKKVRQEMDINESDAQGIVDSLKYGAFVPCMRHEIPESSDDKAVFALNNCPSLAAMERGGYPATCEPVGMRCFHAYVKAINPKARVRFLDGPPRKSPRDVACKWEITIDRDEADVSKPRG